MPLQGKLVIPNTGRNGGGALPHYQGAALPYTPGSAGGARLDASADMGASGVRAIAQSQSQAAQSMAGLAGAADRLVQTGLKINEQIQAARAQEAFNQYELEEMKLGAELATLEGSAALGENGIEARLGSWRPDARERYGKDLGPIARQMFDRAVEKVDAKRDAWAIGKVDKETKSWLTSVSQGTIMNAEQKALASPLDHALANEQKGIILAESVKQARMRGESDEVGQQNGINLIQKMEARRLAAAIAGGWDGNSGGPGYVGGRFVVNGKLGDLRAKTGNVPSNVVQLVRQNANKYGLPEELLLSVMMQESGGNHKVVSKAGATGYMQIMPGLDKEYGMNRHDPVQNIEMGARHLAEYTKEFGGNLVLGLIAYNWGNGNLRSFLRTGKGAKGQPMPKETREYVSRVLGRGGVSVPFIPEGATKIPEELIALGSGGGMEPAATATGSSTPSLAGFDIAPGAEPKFINMIEARNRAAQKKAAAQLVIDESSRVLAALDNQPDQHAREYAANKALDEIRDVTVRAKVKTLVDKELEHRKDLQKSTDMAQAYLLANALRKDPSCTPTKGLERINSSNISQEAKKEAERLFLGEVKDTERNRLALADIRRQIDDGFDRGQPLAETDVYRMAFDARLTAGQIGEALKYLGDGGNRGALTQTAVNRAYKHYYASKGKILKDSDVPAWLFMAVQKLLPPGKEPTPKEVEIAVARTLIDGTLATESGLFGVRKLKRGEAIFEGKQNDFREGELNVPAHSRP